MFLRQRGRPFFAMAQNPPRNWNSPAEAKPVKRNSSDSRGGMHGTAKRHMVSSLSLHAAAFFQAVVIAAVEEAEGFPADHRAAADPRSAPYRHCPFVRVRASSCLHTAVSGCPSRRLPVSDACPASDLASAGAAAVAAKRNRRGSHASVYLSAAG